MSSDETEADRIRFLAQPSSFTPSGGVLPLRQGSGSSFVFLLTALHFLFFTSALGVVVHNFYLLSASLGGFWNWIYAGLASFVLWFLTVLR